MASSSIMHTADPTGNGTETGSTTPDEDLFREVVAGQRLHWCRIRAEQRVAVDREPVGYSARFHERPQRQGHPLNAIGPGIRWRVFLPARRLDLRRLEPLAVGPQRQHLADVPPSDRAAVHLPYVAAREPLACLVFLSLTRGEHRNA